MLVGERIVAVRRFLKLSQKDFAKALNVTQATISRTETNVHSPDLSFINSISQIYNVSLDWLCNGEGDMFTPSISSIPSIQSITNIELVADIAAGLPAFSYEYQPEDRQLIGVPTELLTRPGPYFAFRIDGHSMEPLLLTGDIAIISRDWKGIKLNNVIAAFCNSDGITLKKLVLKGRSRQGFLFPINPAFDPIPYDGDTKDLRMIGVLILTIRLFN